jgi:hypothetical protein
VNGQVRGVLSDKYRRLNSVEIYKNFIQAAKESGAEIYDATYTDTKCYISVILPQVFEIPTENNGSVYSVFGARISSSDFGDGAVDVRAFQMNCVCTNGMVSETMMKQVHLGRRLDDNLSFSDQTYKLDTQATASATRDIVLNALSQGRILTSAQSIKDASVKIIEVDKEIKRLPKLGFSKEESKEVEAKLLNSNPDDGVQGKPTLWKLSQAITSVSNEKGARRKQEMDELAGKLISL